MPLALTSSERRALRARAHALDPVVMISDAGLTTGVLAEIDRNLTSHELIKVRVFTAARADRDQLLENICATLHAAPVQHIGKILVVYRPRPSEHAQHQNRPAPRRRPARRTKRSFQRA